MSKDSDLIYCPICKQKIPFGSSYLHSIFGDTFTYRIACLVTHSRHYHETKYETGLLHKVRLDNDKYEIYKSEVNTNIKKKLINAFLDNKKMSHKRKMKYISAFSDLKHNTDEIKRMIITITDPDQKKLDDFLAASPSIC